MPNAATDAGPHATCEACGAPAVIHISDVKNGVATVQHFCPMCVDAIEQHHGSRRRRRGDAAVIIVIGVMVTLMSLLADVLQFGSVEGFGRRQRQGLFLGVVLLLFSAVVRVRTLFIVAVAAAGMSLLADWLAFGSNPGFGRQQILGCALGTACIILGLWWARRSR